MRARLARIVRQSDAVRTLLDHYPVRIRQLAGPVVTGSRHTKQIFKHWQGDPSTLAESAQSLEAYEGGDVIDVGAFHGWYALLFAPRARPGDAFLELEPDARAFPELLGNLQEVSRWYPHVRLHALPLAVGNGKPMRIEWPMGPDVHPAISSDGTTGDPTVTLDGLCESLNLKPTFVKIDVEGAEAFVLEGMDRLLERHAPTVMLEIHPQWQPANYSVEWLMARMRKHGYQDRLLAEQPLARRILWQRRR
jgi:FkbM family methyltransferase